MQQIRPVLPLGGQGEHFDPAEIEFATNLRESDLKRVGTWTLSNAAFGALGLCVLVRAASQVDRAMSLVPLLSWIRDEPSDRESLHIAFSCWARKLV